MTHDFTLVIPTYDRAQLLAALLSYLEAEGADFRVLVLDSSSPEVMAANRARVQASSLDVEILEFVNVGRGEKWRQGLHKVATPYCALCADDDLPVLEGVRQCLETLRSNPAASVVQGYSFTFLPRPDGNMELHNIVYFTPSIEEATPLRRLAKLFAHYQAPSYGMIRTPALQGIFDVLQPITRLLTRELLWSALTVVEGHVIRVPTFSNGRNMGPSTGHEHWHPLEWFCKDAGGLLAEYLRYRGLMAAALIGRPDNDQPLDVVNRTLDLIHLRYLSKHAPDSVLAFITEQQIAGIPFTDYWPRDDVQLPFYTAAAVGASARAQALGPRHMRGRARSYILFPSFYGPVGAEAPQLEHVIGLTDILDNYRPALDATSS